MLNIQELYSFDLGVEEIDTPFGNKVRRKHKKDVSVIYLSDLIIMIYRLVIFAINEYKNKYLRLKNYMNTLKILKVFEQVSNVFEMIASI